MPRDPFEGTHIGPNGKRVRNDGAEVENPLLTEIITSVRKATARLTTFRRKDEPTTESPDTSAES